MAIFTLLTQTFNVPETSKVFLENYLERVKIYLSRKHLDPSLLDDLSERLSEKLFEASGKENGIVEKDVVSIINELGEPEDIFRDANENRTPESNPRITKEAVKDFFQQEFHRDQKNGIVLGVCAGIWETFWVNPLWIRLLFIILTITYGSGIIVYILLGILLPDASRKIEKNESPKEKIKRQATEFAEDIESQAKSYTENIPVRPVGIIWGFIRTVIQIIVSIIRAFILLIVFIVLWALSLTLFCAWLGIIIWGAISSTSIPVRSLLLFAYVPGWFPGLALACGIALVILSIMIGSHTIKRPIGSGWFALVCVAVLWVGLFGGVYTGTSIISKYANVYEKTLGQTTIETSSGSTIILSDDTTDSEENTINFGNFSLPETAEFVPSPDNKLTVETIVSIRGPDEASAESVFSKIVPIDILFSSWTLSLSKTNSKDFMSPVPFSFLARKIRIKVPGNITIIPRIDERKYQMLHLQASQEMSSYNFDSCYNIPAKFNPTLKSFVCQDSEKIRQIAEAEKLTEKQDQEQVIQEQDDDFFWEWMSWVSIDTIERINEKTVVISWHNEDAKKGKMKVEFEWRDEHRNPLISKKTIITE